MPSIIRLKENETTSEMFQILQNTIYMGLDKTEIIRALLAEKTWSIKTQNSKLVSKLDLITKGKVVKAYSSHKKGKSTLVKNEDIETFLETVAK